MVVFGSPGPPKARKQRRFWLEADRDDSHSRTIMRGQKMRKSRCLGALAWSVNNRGFATKPAVATDESQGLLSFLEKQQQLVI